MWISEDRIDKMLDELYKQAVEKNLTDKFIGLIVTKLENRLKEYERLKWRKEANIIKSVLGQLKS